MQFDKGYPSPAHDHRPRAHGGARRFRTSSIVANQKIGAVKDILPVLEQVIQLHVPLLIAAEDVEGESLATIVVNKLRGDLHRRRRQGAGLR